MSPGSRWLGVPVARKEDRRLLTGSARFVADLRRVDAVEMAVLRSPLAHARIESIDTVAAEAVDGVLRVLTGADLQGVVAPFSQVAISSPPIVAERSSMILGPFQSPVLAIDRVVRTGEPIAVVLATNRYVAEDALEFIEVGLDPLPVVSDPEAALESDATVIHPDIMEDNLHARFEVEVGDVEAAMAASPHRISTRFRFGRSVGSPIETRGALAEMDESTGLLTLWSTTQRSHWLRGYVSSMLGIAESDIRVVAPDMGGSFGSGLYPEDIIVSYAARLLGRPVRWIEDRRENLVNARHARDQIHDVEIGFDDEGRILALDDRFIQDCGAHNPYGVTISYNTVASLRGQLDIRDFRAEARCVLTNKTSNTPVRGAGRPEAVFVLDRLVDMIAHKVGADPAEVRRRNLVTAQQMPYDTGMLYRDGKQMVYDSGDYPLQLDTALRAADYSGWRERQAVARQEGRHLGIGISSHVEGSGIGPFEGASVRVDGTGRLIVHSGSNPHGQSHETTLAQVCAAVFDTTPDHVTVRAGDTSLVAYGGGTNASRSAVTAGSAVHRAAVEVREKMKEVASRILEIDAGDLEVVDGSVRPTDHSVQSLTFAEIAAAVSPVATLVMSGEMEVGLEATDYFSPPTVTFASGTHVVVVEVDICTGGVEILDYVMVDDCGRELNPVIVDGQQQGGVAHGLGHALLEEAIYGEDGQMLAASFADYLLPSSVEVPTMRIIHQNHLSPLNPLGVKGIGEGGTTSAPAAIVNAIADALRLGPGELIAVPLRPSDVLRAVTSSGSGRSGGSPG